MSRLLRWVVLPSSRSVTVDYPPGRFGRKEGPWEEFAKEFQTLERREAKDGPSIVPAEFFTTEEVKAACTTPEEEVIRLSKGGTRRKTINVKRVHAFIFDLDIDGPAQLAIAQAKLKARNVRHIWHTTFSSEKKLRLIIEASDAIPAEKWWDAWHQCRAAIGLDAQDAVDVAAKDACRLYYLPATYVERSDDGKVFNQPGRPLNVAAILERGPWPRSPTSRLLAAKKAQTEFPEATTAQLELAKREVLKIRAVQGQHGNAHAFVVSRILSNDWALSESQAWPILQSWNSTNAEPPWPPEEEPILRDMLRRGPESAQESAGFRREENTPFLAEVALIKERLAAMLAKTSTPLKERPKWKTGQEILGLEFPKAAWLIPGLLPTQGLTIIGADPKASKTWTLLDMAIAISAGGKALGRFEASATGPVALFLTEDGERSVRNRIRALCNGAGYSPERVSNLYIRAREPLDLGDMQRVAEFVADVRLFSPKPLMVALDPLRNVHDAEENSSTEMRPILATLHAIKELCDCALVVVHHSAKKSVGDDRRGGARMRGSSAIDGARDGLISLEETAYDDDGCGISNVVVANFKAHKGAPLFRHRLSILDDEQGEAIKATWEAEELHEEGEEDRKPKREKFDERAIAAKIRDVLQSDKARCERHARIHLGLKRNELILSAGGPSGGQRRLAWYELINQLVDLGKLKVTEFGTEKQPRLTVGEWEIEEHTSLHKPTFEMMDSEQLF